MLILEPEKSLVLEDVSFRLARTRLGMLVLMQKEVDKEGTAEWLQRVEREPPEECGPLTWSPGPKDLSHIRILIPLVRHIISAYMRV